MSSYNTSTDCFKTFQIGKRITPYGKLLKSIYWYSNVATIDQISLQCKTTWTNTVNKRHKLYNRCCYCLVIAWLKEDVIWLSVRQPSTTCKPLTHQYTGCPKPPLIKEHIYKYEMWHDCPWDSHPPSDMSTSYTGSHKSPPK